MLQGWLVPIRLIIWRNFSITMKQVKAVLHTGGLVSVCLAPQFLTNSGGMEPPSGS